MPDDDYEISPPRYFRCTDGRLRKRIIVTFSDKACSDYYAYSDGTRGPQYRIVQSAKAICEKLGFQCIANITSLEYGRSFIPFFANYTIRKLTMVQSYRDRGISPKNSIRYNINLCQNSHTSAS